MTGHFRTLSGEMMRALTVLAFAFLSFAHQPLAIERYGVSPAVTGAFVCGAAFSGDPDGGSNKSTGLCDACRIATAIDLPAPPSLACPVLKPLGRSDSGFSAVMSPEKPVLAGGGPRAPPFRALA